MRVDAEQACKCVFTYQQPSSRVTLWCVTLPRYTTEMTTSDGCDRVHEGRDCTNRVRTRASNARSCVVCDESVGNRQSEYNHRLRRRQTPTRTHMRTYTSQAQTSTQQSVCDNKNKKTKTNNQKQDEEVEHSQVRQSVTVFIVVQCTEHPPTLVQAFILNKHG